MQALCLPHVCSQPSRVLSCVSCPVVTGTGLLSQKRTAVSPLGGATRVLGQGLGKLRNMGDRAAEGKGGG